MLRRQQAPSTLIRDDRPAATEPKGNPAFGMSPQAPELHEKQMEAVDSILEKFRQRELEVTKVCLRGVPGSGKTLVAAKVISEACQFLDCKAALFISPLKELTSQTGRNLRVFFEEPVKVEVFVSKLRRFKRPLLRTVKKAGTEDLRLKVVRGGSVMDEDADEARRRTLASLGEDGPSPCVISASTSAIYPGLTHTCLTERGSLAPEVAVAVAKQLEEELKKQRKKAAARTGNVKFRNREARDLWMNREARDLRMQEDIEKLKKVLRCPDMFDLYGDLLDPKTLIDLMNDKFGAHWILVVDECHSTWPMLGIASTGYRTQVQAHVENGRARSQLLPVDDVGAEHRGNGPLTLPQLERRLPHYVLNMSATPQEKAGGLLGEKVELDFRPTGILEPEIFRIEMEGCQQGPGDTRHKTWSLYCKICGLLGITSPGEQEKEDRPRQEGEQVIISCVTNNQAEVLWGLLTARGEAAAVVHGAMDSKKKAAALQEFREGQVDILLGSKGLIEGLDFPSVAMVIVPDADGSGLFRAATPLKQLIGRASRHKDGRVYFLTTQEHSAILDKIELESAELRKKQAEYNAEKGLKPTSIQSQVRSQRKESSWKPEEGLEEWKICLRATAAILQECCRFKRCVEEKEEQDITPYWMKRSTRMVLEQDFFKDSDKLFEQIVLSVTVDYIGPDRSRCLLDKLGNIDYLLSPWCDRAKLEAVPLIGENISEDLYNTAFRKQVKNTRKKLSDLKEMLTSLLDRSHLPEDPEEEADNVLTDVKQTELSKMVRLLAGRMLELVCNDLKGLRESKS